jgi:lysine biosynthesis protein LysW
MAICPDCAREFYLEEDDLAIGDIVHCEECGVELEVVKLLELELKLTSAGEDDEDEEEEEEEEEEEFETVFDDDGYYESDDEEY